MTFNVYGNDDVAVTKTPRKKVKEVKPVEEKKQEYPFYNSGKIDVELVKKHLGKPSESYFIGFYALPATCSAAEMSTPLTLEAFARNIKSARQSMRKLLIVNLSPPPAAHEFVKQFGFKEVMKYMGNHNNVVTTYMCDINDLKV